MTWLEPGHPASDYSCPACGFWYQLKSQKSRLGDSITDGAYAAMVDAIKRDELPSFYFMQYEICSSRRQSAQTSPPEFQMEPTHVGCHSSPEEGILWSVRNLLLIPHFAFPPSAIIKRKPLSSTARRHGWVGCNFALNRIPVEARIPLVITRSSPARRDESAPSSSVEGRESQSRLTSAATIIVPPEEVRERFKRVKPLKDIPVQMRGWTLDVLNAVRRLVEERRASVLDCGGRAQRRHRFSGAITRSQSGVTAAALHNEFTTAEAYIFERELEQLHPDNRHVKDKIRQQLQVLRDAGLLLHICRGEWRLP